MHSAAELFRKYFSIYSVSFTKQFLKFKDINKPTHVYTIVTLF